MSNHPETCFECGEGHYIEVVEDYRRALPDGETLTVPKLLILRCDKCGEDTIPPESSRRIETAVDQHQDTLPAAAVRSFLEQFQIDQTEAAEALGMGGKTLHRWARGTQRVSRSMGYFLRALMAHPAVYEWIRDRSWRRAEQRTNETVVVQLGGYWEAEYQVRFPASRGHASETRMEPTRKPASRRFNAARGLQNANIQ
ncbi:MAG: putative zinc finger/helix-turn-helix YgiT family protein [Candidatus Binatia bacterium]|jgi:putative zinc finger/helix-turn-helix YgiT family protein